jgi:ribonucleases P/MRP protein subunit RPP40
MESVVKDSIVKHLEKNGFIKKLQHGFMAGRSCTSNLLAFWEKVTAELDNSEPVDVIYLYFTKAFDTVPHERLKKKLRANPANGISGGLLRWIAAWLSDRKQRVVLNGRESMWEAIFSGLPQGSMLGPLLFLRFINDLNSAVSKAEILCKFADDTKLARVVKSEEDRQRLQAALERLVAWTETWGMTFNVKKCRVMHLGRNSLNSDYAMCRAQLEVTKERDIGVTINNLKPAAQCAKAAREAQLYKQYVRPHLAFAVQAWSPWHQADKEAQEKVQRRAVGMVSGLRSVEYEDRLPELGLTTFEERRHPADMLQMFKIINGAGDLQITDWFGPPTVRTR